MPSIFEKKKEERSGSIFRQEEKRSGSIFNNVTPSQVAVLPEPESTQSENPLVRQFFNQAFQQAPFGKRILSYFPEREQYYSQTPQAESVAEKVASGGGSLAGMAPSFAVGGLAGGPVAGATTRLASKFMPSMLAKLVGLSAGGATTFPVARTLRNIGQNRLPLEGTPEEAKMGAIYGVAGLPKTRFGAAALGTALGAMTAPEGEKLPQAILFGGLQALTHTRPDLTQQDLGNIEKLYKEATTKETIRKVIKTQSQPLGLPAPSTIYGEGFTAGQPYTPQFPVSGQKLLPSLPFGKQEVLGKGEVAQGEGFTVKGGKRIAYRKSGMELRTTPTPEKTIQTVARQEPTIIKNILPVNKQGVVTVKSDLTPIPQPKATPTGEGKVGKQITSDLEAFVQGGKGKYNISIIQYPTGKWGFVGSIPEELTRPIKSSYAGIGKDSKIFNTKEEAMQAYSKHAKEKIEQFKKEKVGEYKVGKEEWVSEAIVPTDKPIPKVIKTPQVEVSQSPKEFYAKIKVGEEWVVPGEGGRTFKSGKWITDKSKKMTSEKAIEILRKTIKNPIISEEGDYLVIRGQGGFATLDWLQPLEYVGKTATQIYRGIAPAGEVLRNDKLVSSIMAERQRKLSEVQSGTLPEGLKAQRLQEIMDSERAIQAINQSGGKDESLIISKSADAVDMERAFQNKYTNILDLADKVGITKGSRASEIVFKALDYKRASAKELSQLTPEQQKFIPIFRNAYKEIWKMAGKEDYEGVRDYATHLINTGKEKGYDVSSLGRFLPDELYSRFFEKRVGGKPYTQDIIEAFDTYIPNVSRKIFREPILDQFNMLEPYLGADFKNEAVDYMEAFLGRGRYRGQEVLGRLPKDLVRLTYRGTLYGNFSAATKNATQVLTNTIPEIGNYTTYGFKRFLTPEGRADFHKSGLAGDFTMGKPIDALDFFSQVEYLNRGITYLGAREKALNEGKNIFDAEQYARKIVRKTQFIQTGIDTPKLFRQYGSAGRIMGQFTQFPIKQGFLLMNWARNKEFGKLARFGAIAYLLGGTDTVPFLNRAISYLPEEEQKKLRDIERYTSLAGLAGLNIGQNFGLGIYSSGVPFARGPVASTIPEIGRFAYGIKTHEIKTLQDVIRSRLFQRSLPTYIPGGSAMKKVIDLINNDLNDYKIRNAYNVLQYTSTPKEEVARLLVGSTKERKEAWESIRQDKQEDTIYKNEHRKMLDYTLDSKGDWLALEEFMKKYPHYDFTNIVDELMARAKVRETPAIQREMLKRPKALRYGEPK